jgi:hypothetical protein
MGEVETERIASSAYQKTVQGTGRPAEFTKLFENNPGHMAISNVEDIIITDV